MGLALNRPVRPPKKFRVEPFALEFVPGIDLSMLNQLADELDDPDCMAKLAVRSAREGHQL